MIGEYMDYDDINGGAHKTLQEGVVCLKQAPSVLPSVRQGDPTVEAICA